jgi:hypothetical protein
MNNRPLPSQWSSRNNGQRRPVESGSSTPAKSRRANGTGGHCRRRLAVSCGMSAPLGSVLFLGMYVSVFALLLHSLSGVADWRRQLDDSPSVQQNSRAMQAYLQPSNHCETP